MRLSKFLIFMIGITLTALVYIQLQVQIFHLAYQGKQREKIIQRLKDDNGDVMYNICALKSANHLGVKLLNEDSEMQFMERTQIVLVTTPAKETEQKALAFSRQRNRGLAFLSNLFSLKAQAEARTVRK